MMESPLHLFQMMCPSLTDELLVLKTSNGIGSELRLECFFFFFFLKKSTVFGHKHKSAAHLHDPWASPALQASGGPLAFARRRVWSCRRGPNV